jgi:SSS family solute:Na+ symporter
VSAFLDYIGIQWWSSWYPGAEPGGGGYVAQRMMSAKDEKHSLFATLWFTIAHYCIRPWPWIIVGLATLVLYPELDAGNKRLGYVYAMRDFLPAGIKGLLVASFFAAYMSTIATQLNWGTSYVINDFYKRFVRPNSDDRSLVRVSRIATIVIMLLSIVITGMLDTISGAWAFILEAGAGLGLVLILRWFWWRINAWSEITAMVLPLIVYAYMKSSMSIQFPESLFVIVAVTTVGWVATTFITPPTTDETLRSFYKRVHPGGIGWKRIADQMPEVRGDSGYAGLFLDWVAGVVLVYMALFGVGKLILGDTTMGLIFLMIGGLAAWVIYRDLSKRGFETVVK